MRLVGAGLALPSNSIRVGDEEMGQGKPSPYQMSNFQPR